MMYISFCAFPLSFRSASAYLLYHHRPDRNEVGNANYCVNAVLRTFLWLSVRSTNVYEERSIGVFEVGDDDLVKEPSTDGPRVRVWGRHLAWHAKKQFANGTPRLHSQMIR